MCMRHCRNLDGCHIILLVYSTKSKIGLIYLSIQSSSLALGEICKWHVLLSFALLTGAHPALFCGAKWISGFLKLSHRHLLAVLWDICVGCAGYLPISILLDVRAQKDTLLLIHKHYFYILLSGVMSGVGATKINKRWFFYLKGIYYHG